MSSGPKIVIVGGVAGGASAAARARRLSESAEITLFERGAHISFANCGMPYHIGGEIAERDRLLVQTPEGMRKRFHITVRTRTEVVRIDRAAKLVVARDLATGADISEPYDKLILSPGAEQVRPPIPGAELPRVYTLRNLADMDAIRSAMDAATVRHAVIVGGGYIGLEMAEAFRRRGWGVTLAELTGQVMGPADPEMATPLHQQLQLQGVDLRLNTSVTGLAEDGDALRAALSAGGEVRCGLAVIAVGVRPDSRLAREAGLTVSERGAVIVDDHMRTNDPDIFAVGDAVEVREIVSGRPASIPLAGPANRQGRIAAENALGRDSAYKGSQGTAICKVFDLAIGMTGLSEKALRRFAIPYEKVYVHPAHHAGYYPGAQAISLKLLFDPKSGKLLGAQAVGAAGVDKRIDVLAVALRAGLTVYDLEEMELSYAPPYGSAKDPINYAGFVAANVLRGDVALCRVEEVLHPRDDQALLDVRTDSEAAAGTIPGARLIPVDDLRARLGELPREKEILIFCQVGLRGYLASRILSQNGFRCRNLSGGYKTYAMTTHTVQPPKESKEMRDDTGAGQAARPPAETAGPVHTIDARGLQCPGPILRLSREMETLPAGRTVVIRASDPGFASDIQSWCHSTGHEFRSVVPEPGSYCATLVKRCAQAAPACAGAPGAGRKKTVVLFSDDFDRAMAAFIIANGAAAMGSEVTLFFTFWGINVLRRADPVAVRKTPIERMFGWMMPRGAQKLTLSKMHMAGMGTAMMRGIMKRKNVASLPELIASAQKAGVRLVACSMSMDLMGIRKEELIDGVEAGGVAMYLDHAEGGNVNLFI